MLTNLAILMAIKPADCELIANLKKTVIVSKIKPKLKTPFKVYIYCTKDNKLNFWTGKRYSYSDERSHNLFDRCGNGKVIGEFVCDKVDRIAHCGTCNRDISLKIVDENLYCKELDYAYLDKCQLSYSDINEYSNGCGVYGWHITNLVIYDKLRELGEFIRVCPEWEKGEITDKCLECEHLYTSPIEHFIGCDYEGEIPITRPPRSWCYVESEVES